MYVYDNRGGWDGRESFLRDAFEDGLHLQPLFIGGDGRPPMICMAAALEAEEVVSFCIGVL